jgi:hypothetical protein
MTTTNEEAAPSENSGTAAPHPEEMSATAELRIGDRLCWKATARATPAGLVAAALLVFVVVIPALWSRGKK